MVSKQKALIITEKPSVARDIVAALGGFQSQNQGAYWESETFLCTFAVGHIFTLLAPEDIDPALKSWQLKTLPILPRQFQLKPISGHEKRIQVIKKLIQRTDVSCLINACDSAREGELIFREIVQYLDAKHWVRRVWLQSLTPEAIRTGFAALRDGTDFDGLAAAAACRARADWLIGMNATRAFSLKLRSQNRPERFHPPGVKTKSIPWSVGRVQTPTLALLVRRELEILRHVPKPFFRLIAKFATQGAEAHEYEASWFDPKFKKPASPSADDLSDERDDRIFEPVHLAEVLAAIKNAKPPALASERRDQSLRQAPPLFNLTALQKYMASRYKWSSQRTLESAQRCYEQHKILTYPRTSSSALPGDYQAEVTRLIHILAEQDDYRESAKFLQQHGRRNEKRIFDDSAVSDHFAIIPTGKIKDISGDDGKLYDVVVRRFLAAFFPPAVYDKVKRTTVIGGQHFRTGPIETLVEPGWMAVHGKEAEDPRIIKLPALVSGQAQAEHVPVNLVADKNHAAATHEPMGVTVKEEMTKPPSRINEAKLLSLMEHAGRQVEDEELATALMSAEGLGTAATRADIIQNLKLKEYIDGDLRPTAKGLELIETLDRLQVKRLTSAELTARMELELAEVEKGQRPAQRFMQSVVDYTIEIVAAAKSLDTHPVRTALAERARRTASPVPNENTTDQSNHQLAGPPALAERAGAKTPRRKAGTTAKHPEHDAADTLGVCPLHAASGCQVIETKNSYMCTTKLDALRQGDHDAVGISLPKTLCQRAISRREAQAYLQGSTPELKNFISKQGRPFAAKLVLTPSGRASFVFPERPTERISHAKHERRP